MSSKWIWTDTVRKELPNRKTLLKAYLAEAEGLQKLHVRASKQLVRLQLEEQMLLRILVTARNNLPPDSCLRLEEPAELQEALAHVEPIPQSRANLHQCSAGEHNGPQHSGEPERIANGQDPAEPPSDNDQIPEWVAEEDDEEDPGPPRRCEPAAEGNEAAIAATARPRKRKTQQNSKRVAADEPPSRAMPSAKRRGRASRQPVDKGGVWEAAGEAKEEGLDHLGDLVFGGLMQEIAAEEPEDEFEEGGDSEVDLLPASHTAKQQQKAQAKSNYTARGRAAQPKPPRQPKPASGKTKKAKGNGVGKASEVQKTTVVHS